MSPLEPRTFDHLAGFDGLSERCMREHLKLYQGYIAKYNELARKCGLRAKGQLQPDPDTESLKVDIAFALSAIKNHELFFDILGNDDDEPTRPPRRRYRRQLSQRPPVPCRFEANRGQRRRLGLDRL